MKITLKITSDRHGDEIAMPERFVIDLNELGEARIRHRHTPQVDRDESTVHVIADGHGGTIALVLEVEAEK